MRRLRHAIILLSIALIGATVLVLRSPPGPGGTMTLLSLVPSQVESIRLDAPGQPPIIVRQEGHRREWMIVVGGSDGVDSRWPASEARVRAALRVLSALTGATSDPLPDADVGSVVTIVSGGGSEWRLRLAAQTLAGRGRIRVEAPTGEIVHALVDDDVHAMLAWQHVMQWRDTRALPGSDGAASRFRAETGDSELRLASVRGRWGIQSPFVAPAEPKIVQELLRSVEALAVIRFRDEQDVAETGRPLLVMEIETDVSSPTGDERDRKVIVRRLSVLEPADASGMRYVVRSEAYSLAPHTRSTEAIVGPAFVEVAADALAALPLDPETFIARRAVAVPPADVGRVELGPLMVERTHEGWVRIDGDRPVPVAGEHAAGLEAVLTLLADIPADVVRRVGAEPPTGFEQVADVSLRGLDGADLGSFTLGVAPLDASAPQPEVAAVVLDRVAMRLYRAARSRDAIAWLAQHRQE